VRQRILYTAALGAALVALLAAPLSAERRTFPGRNGELALGVGGTIVTENPDGTGRRTIVPLKSGVAVAATEPAWSPDGTRIAFSSKIGGTGGIMIVNADGSGLTRVTSDTGDGEPTWSPDGKRLAYVHVSTGGRRLVVSNLDGTGLTVITATLERDVDDPEWSPDGTRIAFGDGTDVYVVGADGSNLVDLTADPAHLQRADNPSWSPDGGKIAFQFQSSIQTIAPDGSGVTTLASNLGAVWELSWSPDGTEIAFASDVGGPLQEEVFTIEADGTGLTRTGIDADSTLDWGVAAAAPPPPAVSPPVLGKSVDLAPVGGVVLVRLPRTKTFVPLASLKSVPLGAELDATRGRIRLTSAGSGGATQTADFYQGRAVVGQTRGAVPVTTLTLSGPLVCPRTKRTSSATRPPRTRSLWGSGKGNFQTKGHYASASVRGTIWLTQDRCDGTLVRVRAGRVQVFDRVRRRTVTVRAGASYLARARR
jgi:WD40-like Beta Propeller Repeat